MMRTTPEAYTIPDGIDAVCLDHAGHRSVFATAVPGATDDFESLLFRVERALLELEAEALEMRVFATVDAIPCCRKAFLERSGPIDWPVLLIGTDGCRSPGIAGIQVRAVAGVPVETVRLGDRPVGRLFEDHNARYCFLGDLRPSNTSWPRTGQLRETLALVEETLGRVGMDLHRVVRTWFFIDDILDWYADFNTVRGEVYAARGVFERYVPASTGIGQSDACGGALVASALALEPKRGGVAVREVASPLQCSPRDYGSSFSRAAEVATPDWRWVLVSGTASIDSDGRAVHAGDVSAQVARTLDVVEAILASRSMDFTDVVRANAYFRHADDAATLASHVARVGLPASRLLVSNNTVCRDELLFELEVDAVKAGDSGRPRGRGEDQPGA